MTTASRRTNVRPDPLRLLGLAEAAKILGVDDDYLKVLLEDGVLGGIKRGREWRVPYRALEVWVEKVAQGTIGYPPGGAPPEAYPAAVPGRVPPGRRGRPPKRAAG